MPELAERDDQGGELWDLRRLAAAEGLCGWMFDQFRDHVGPSVVEVGAGIGTFTDRLLASGAREVLTIEPEPACADELDRRYADDPRVSNARELLPDSAALATRACTVDLVLCQNVLEHVEDDAGAVAAMGRALRPGGSLALLVPAHPRLYGRLDRRYGHFRRYDRARLRSVVERAGLVVEDLYSFNLLGVPGWVVKSRVGDPTLDSRSLRTYEALLRGWRPIEDRLRLPWGLSLIALARRPSG